MEQVSCQKASANYLKEVKRSHFVSSDKVHLGFHLPNAFISKVGEREKEREKKNTLHYSTLIILMWRMGSNEWLSL